MQRNATKRAWISRRLQINHKTRAVTHSGRLTASQTTDHVNPQNKGASGGLGDLGSISSYLRSTPGSNGTFCKKPSHHNVAHRQYGRQPHSEIGVPCPIITTVLSPRRQAGELLNDKRDLTMC